MSKEQAATYKKFRTAVDPTGNLTWAARMTNKAVRISPETHGGAEDELELNLEERVLWRLMRIPRKYLDLEHTKLLPQDQCRAFFRGLVSADMIDLVEAADAKAVLPVEVDRMKRELSGQGPAPKPLPMKARVYRPTIDGPEPDAAPEPEPAPAPAPKPASSTSTAPPKHSVAAPVELTAVEQGMKQDLERMYSTLSSTNHYQFLGVQAAADDAQIKSAFLKRAKELHPDRISGSGLGRDAAFMEKVDQLFKRLQDANRTLSNKDDRANYDRNLAAGHGQSSTSGKKVRRPEEAHVMFTKAEHLMKRKEVKQAEIHFRAAVELDWDDPKIATGLAWCIWLNDDHKRDERVAEAKKRLDETMKKFKYADAAYKLGLIHRTLGDEAAAQKRFQEALRYDEGHVDASREVRLSGMRAEKGAREDAGLFGKMFKK